MRTRHSHDGRGSVRHVAAVGVVVAGAPLATVVAGEAQLQTSEVVR
jgi:hypothetical protein